VRSRFQVDLNRVRDKAVYLTPQDSWGITVWKDQQGPPQDMKDRSLQEYDLFYSHLHALLSDLQAKYGFFCVLDLHSYNHRRNGPNKPPNDPALHPSINIGTSNMNRVLFDGLVKKFMFDLSNYEFPQSNASNFPGGKLDVKENLKFQGGALARWVHQTFPNSGCALAIEFKKFFMDEWTGKPDMAIIAAIVDALRSTIPGITEQLEELRKRT